MRKSKSPKVFYLTPTPHQQSPYANNFSALYYDQETKRYAVISSIHMINITFSKYVKMNGRQWEVNFRKMPGTSLSFYVDTPDLQGNRFQFSLNKNGQSEWELKGAELPNWFGDYLPDLINAAESGVLEYKNKYVLHADLY